MRCGLRNRICCVHSHRCGNGTSMAGQSSGQNSSTDTEASSGYNNQTEPSNAGARYKELSLRLIQANPNACNVQDDLRRRSLRVP